MRSMRDAGYRPRCEEWRRLSRLSKRELLADGSTERITHTGAWFEKARLALGLR